jgi:hypothetical protein
VASSLNIDSAPPATAAPGDMELSPAETLEAPFEVVAGLVIVFGGQKIYCEINENARRRNISETLELTRSRMAEITRSRTAEPYFINKHFTHNKYLDSHQEKQEKNNPGNSLKVKNLQANKESQQQQQREFRITYQDFITNTLEPEDSSYSSIRCNMSQTIDLEELEKLEKRSDAINNSALWCTMEDYSQTDELLREDAANSFDYSNRDMYKEVDCQITYNPISKDRSKYILMNQFAPKQKLNTFIFPPNISSKNNNHSDGGITCQDLLLREDAANSLDYSNRDIYKEVDCQIPCNPISKDKSKYILMNQFAPKQKLNTFKNNNHSDGLSKLLQRIDAFINSNPINKDVNDDQTNNESSQTDSIRSDSI